MVWYFENIAGLADVLSFRQMAALRVNSFCMFLGTCNEIMGQIKFMNSLHIESTWKWRPKSECQSIRGKKIFYNQQKLS